MDVSAPGASHRPVLKAGASRGRVLNKRARLALRAAGMRYRAGRQSRGLNFRHVCSYGSGGSTTFSVTGKGRRRSVIKGSGRRLSQKVDM